MGKSLDDLIETVRRLRAPGGCPWDQEQTHQSLRPYLIEETYELLEVLDQIKVPEDLKNPIYRDAFCEELGDVLLQVLLHSAIANETVALDIETVALSLNEKLIRRHPHVFGDVKVSDSKAVVENWQKIKNKEKDKTVLAGIPSALPALQKTIKVIDRVTKVGFQWPDLNGPWAKIEEELTELKAEVFTEEKDLKKIKHEIGDLLFTISNIAFLLDIDPEEALRENLNRFQKRFEFVERKIEKNGQKLKSSTLEQMDNEWNKAKILERVIGLTGGIASGKSTVAKVFEENGIPTLDADQIAKKLREPGQPGHSAILKAFGDIDPKALREQVFKDPEKRATLEQILHPLIEEESLKQFQSILNKNPKTPFILYEGSLLVETDRYQDFLGLIVVHAEPSARKSRLEKQMPKELADNIIAAQLTDSERLEKIKQKTPAIFEIIENKGTTTTTIEQLRTNSKKLFQKIFTSLKV